MFSETENVICVVKKRKSSEYTLFLLEQLCKNNEAKRSQRIRIDWLKFEQIEGRSGKTGFKAKNSSILSSKQE